MWKGARVRGRCHPYKRRPETPLRRRGTARSCRWTPLSPRERLNLMPSRRLSGERGRDARRKAHLLGAPAEGLRAVSGVSEATCDSLAWWDAVWQERDAHHRNWNGVTYVGAYRPLPPAARATYLLLRCQCLELRRSKKYRTLVGVRVGRARVFGTPFSERVEFN